MWRSSSSLQATSEPIYLLHFVQRSSTCFQFGATVSSRSTLHIRLCKALIEVTNSNQKASEPPRVLHRGSITIIGLPSQNCRSALVGYLLQIVTSEHLILSSLITSNSMSFAAEFFLSIIVRGSSQRPTLSRQVIWVMFVIRRCLSFWSSCCGTPTLNMYRMAILPIRNTMTDSISIKD